MLTLHDMLALGVRKPARYCGSEYFPTGYVPPVEGDLRFALCYPDIYEIGMSNTGLRILYSILRRAEGVYADLAFCPWDDMEEALRKSGEKLVSRHGGIPLGDFDVLGFSLQYELNYSNVLTMLALGGVPLRSADRGDDDPIVVGGGPCATHPEPVAVFFDIIVAGDGEDGIQRLAADLRESRGLPREQRLARLAEFSGFYVPSRHEPSVSGPDGHPALPGLAVKRLSASALDSYLPFPDFPVPALETVFDRLSLELARGCHQGCRFCEAGFAYRPPRERSVEALLEWAEETLDSTGFTGVSLASLSSADYSCLLPLVQRVKELGRRKNASVTVSSLRAYGLEDGVLETLAGRSMSSLTLAPEAGSQRLRDVINKNVTREQLLGAVQRIAEAGINRVKLYFMLGLPGETEADLDEIARLSFDCHDILRGRFRAKAAVVLSTSMFVPRPHTPFQWEGMASVDELKSKVAYLRDHTRRKGVQFKWHDPDMSWLEAVLTRGDRRVAEAIEHAWKLGARFDSWDEKLDIGVWRTAFADADLEPSAYLRALAPDAALPWSHMKIAVAESLLLRERERAQAGKTTKPCEPFVEEGLCHACGAKCDQAAPVSRPAGPPENPSPPSEVPTPPPEVVERRHRLTYRKVGNAILLGHLDLLRQFTLAFRRARISMARTRGFNPRPRIYFPAALPLGHYGLEETVDVLVTDDVDSAALPARLNEVLVPGIEVVSAMEVLPGMPKVSALKSADFLLGLADADPGPLRQAIADANIPHLLSLEFPSPDVLPSILQSTTPPGLLIRISWAQGSSPRIDRNLTENVEGVGVLWVARERLRYE